MSDYYVDPAAGADSNNGLSPETAWKTLAKVNGKPFKAGDHIRFAAGADLANALRITNLDGTSGAIVYEPYGKGGPPRFTEIRTSACKGIRLDGLFSGGCFLMSIQGAELVNLECAGAYGNGLEVKGSSGVKVTGGRFHDNGHLMSGGGKIGHGILIGGGVGAGPVTVERARCYSNWEDGIQFAPDAVNGSTVTGCAMFDNREDGVDVKGGSHSFTGNCMWGNAQRAIGLHLRCRVTTLEGNTFHCYRYGLTVADGASVRSSKNGYVSLIRSSVLLDKTAASSAFAGDVFAAGDPSYKALDNKSTVAQVFDQTTTLQAYNWVKTPTDAEGVDVDNPSGEGEVDDDAPPPS